MKPSLVRLIGMLALILIPSALISIYTGNFFEIVTCILIFMASVIGVVACFGLLIYLVGVVINGSFKSSEW